MKFVIVDGCPVPLAIAPQVRQLKKDVPSAVLQSCYRGDLATNLLKRLHKSTQAMLYYGWLHRLPGYNPANPPGRSTHELRSDGVAYRGPVGRGLFAWQCGMDWNDAAITALQKAARKHGWTLFRPYASGSEYHHLNFKRRPVLASHQAKHVQPSEVSKALVSFVAGMEGFRGGVYRDAVGVETIGYGETARPIIERYRANGIPRGVALDLLRDRLNHVYGAAVLKLVRVPISQLQFDALTSFAYNLGTGALESSTLLRVLNGGHYAKAANEFRKWNKAGGRVLPGLTRRREAERAMFLKGSNRGTRIVAARRGGGR